MLRKVAKAWQKLQMEDSYAGVLIDPYEGEELPESFRYFGISNNEPAGIKLAAGTWWYLREMDKLRGGVFGKTEPPLSIRLGAVHRGHAGAE